jgi:hypothetical protein
VSTRPGGSPVLNWDGDLLRFDSVTLHVAHLPDAEHPPGTLPLRKTRTMVEHMLEEIRIQPQRIVELGSHEGGSACLWFECFRPKRLVTVDVAPGPSSPVFASYRERTGLRAYWGVDQADTERLKKIVRAEFDEPLDLVIDDASHMYEPTKASFDLLFPLLRPGGLYVIEDWDWERLPKFQAPHPWSKQKGLVALIEELKGRSDVGNVSTYRSFAIVERVMGSVIGEQASTEPHRPRAHL